jgi:hypothetical protein
LWGRTVLSIVKDNHSGAEVPVKVNFGVDGQFTEYVTTTVPQDGVEENEGFYTVIFGPGLTVLQGDTLLLRVNFTDGNMVQIEPGFFDPRTNTDNSALANGITLTCKEYLQEP